MNRLHGDARATATEAVILTRLHASCIGMMIPCLLGIGTQRIPAATPVILSRATGILHMYGCTESAVAFIPRMLDTTM